MARVYARIICRHHWWLKYYPADVLAIALVTGREPNPGRIAYWVGRGLKVEVH
jgi:hypothetical protein